MYSCDCNLMPFFLYFRCFFSFVVTNYLTEAAGGNGQKGDLWGEGGGHVIWCRPTHRKLPLVASLHLYTLPILPSLASSSSSNPWAHLLHRLSSCAKFSVRFTERNTLGFFHQNKANTDLQFSEYRSTWRWASPAGPTPPAASCCWPSSPSWRTSLELWPWLRSLVLLSPSTFKQIRSIQSGVCDCKIWF